MGTDDAPDVTKLKLSSLKLYGRGKELERLHDSLQQICEPDVYGDITSEIVLVRGASGTGKTALIETLRDPVIKEHGGYFVSGKFEQVHGTTRPYSAIVSAFTQLCDDILQSDDRDKTVNEIKKALGNEVGVLTNVLPRLAHILGVEESVVENTGCSTQEGDLRTFDRLLRLFRTFVRAVCASSRPVVIFLDDLQWIDAASLDLMTYLANKTAATNFLLIGSYRDNEVDKHHPLSVKLEELKESSKVIITTISLGGIDKEEVNDLVADATGLPVADTRELTELIYRKSRGNCLYVIQLLELLQERQFLRFSAESCRWQWDLSRIKGETNLSVNVIEIVVERMQRLPKFSQDVLKIAACLGTLFDPYIVALTMRSQVIRNEDVGTLVSMDCCSFSNGTMDEYIDMQVQQSIGFLVKMSLLEQGPSQWMKFSHDRIHQCAYLLISEDDEREHLHLLIGHLLLRACEVTPTASDGMLFTTVDQLNRGSRHIVKQSERIELARLNLEAAKMAKAKSAFIPASEYIRAALKLLEGPLRWEENYELSRELCSYGAEMERCSGNGERCKAMVDEVLSNARSLQDRFHAQVSYIKLLGGQGRLEDAVDEGVKVLGELGEMFPRKPNVWHTITMMVKTKRLLSGMSNEQLVSLPVIDDPSRLAALKLLATLGIYTFFSTNKKYLPLFFCRIIQSSVIHGMNQFTAYGFASYGLILTMTGDINGGFRFGMLALELVEKRSPVEQTPKVVVIVHCFIHHWKKPLQSSLLALLHGYKVGMELGDIENGLLCAASYCTIYLCCGLPLGPLADDAKNYIQQMIEYQQDTLYYGVLPFWQYALNLIGPSENPLVLTGEAMDQEKVSKEATETGNTVALRNILALQQQLAYIFGDLKSAKRLLKEMRKLKDGITAPPGYCREIFFLGMTSLWLARSTRKRKYRMLAQYYMGMIEKWVNNKAVNCYHMLLLMKAESASLRIRGAKVENVRKVRQAYDVAISSAARSGFIQDAALGSERAAIFHLAVWDEMWAESYLFRALGWYREWGAGAKVSQLTSRYDFLLSDKTWASTGLSVHGRSRFDHKIALNHRKIALGENL